jgi:phosphoadenosine phosphosulfate reductase
MLIHRASPAAPGTLIARLRARGHDGEPTAALQFGGGKDSLACLHLLEECWDGLLVAWLNTGAAFPETIELMERVAGKVPHFLEVRTDVCTDIEARGWPVDVLPIAHSEPGRLSTGEKALKLRGWNDCCGANLWRPMHQVMVERRIKTIIRGQRLSEHYKSPVRSGDVIDGIEYVFPLEDWSEAEVFAFLRERGVEIPAYYEELNTSLDCWCCTAFLDAKAAQLHYMRKRHPEKHAIVQGKLREIAQATAAALQPFRQVIEQGE